MHLLLIEDDPTIAHELTLRWARRGWQVHNAISVAAARNALALPGLFDLVLLDLNLPDGDGMDLLATLRRSDSRTPVLVLTARDQVADRVLGLRQGADDYLVKPFAPDELDARVESLLRRTSQVPGQRFNFGPLHWLGDEGRACLGDTTLELSPREFEAVRTQPGDQRQRRRGLHLAPAPAPGWRGCGHPHGAGFWLPAGAGGPRCRAGHRHRHRPAALSGCGQRTPCPAHRLLNLPGLLPLQQPLRRPRSLPPQPPQPPRSGATCCAACCCPCC